MKLALSVGAVLLCIGVIGYALWDDWTNILYVVLGYIIYRVAKYLTTSKENHDHE